ncbi:hypothetical protein L6164_028954 [Bauhinia variegata]|uniref:Uncharacterized protein n=1 Tax=Bauhinia variegata TaxID=167791 RepID=A0ACB9L7I6_BAUVA|nr:hypothetical protein L6164_028954 [Bauhinia variegata]
MLTARNVISCNFSTLPSLALRNPKLKIQLQTHNPKTRKFAPKIVSGFVSSLKSFNAKTPVPMFQKKGSLHICHSSLKEDSTKSELRGSGNGGEGRDWTTSILLFVLWGALMYYVFFLAPNQTPFRDKYFLEKLLNLKGDDGFRMNQVLVSLWYIMGLWPLVYGMLLLPTGRSAKSKIPAWPFLVLSFFLGVYALIPYFVLWQPPPPPVEETELRTWPLNFMESKVTSAATLAAGAAIIIYAGLATGADWTEFFQYFRESKFIHIMSLDFSLLSAFAPFWVYNDMTTRKWFDNGSWLLLVSLVPFLGPAVYILLRPSLSTTAISESPSE